MAETGNESRLGYMVIGTLKLISALLLAGAGFGLFRLLNANLGQVIEQNASRLHLDPENRFVHEAIHWAAGIDRAHLKAVGVGTFFYAGLEGLEGAGLLLRKRWAEYLTIIATGLLLPIEVSEIARHADLIRVAVLLANLAILAYLIGKVWKLPKARRVAGNQDLGSLSSRRAL